METLYKLGTTLFCSMSGRKLRLSVHRKNEKRTEHTFPRRLGEECDGQGRFLRPREEEDASQQGNAAWSQNHRYCTYDCIYSEDCMTCIVLSFMELVPLIFKMPGVRVFLSEHLCQDPLEKFFGCQRQRGGAHDNPNVEQFCKNTQALRVINSFCKGPVRGNCQQKREQCSIEEESAPLPKRKRAHR
ncbi:hypothetical protein SPONN_2631 [uncultured Candidatus Thioglobus sp.]|nr:hypothetical protein SPONN_2631 [uncultured Candidatus Thioglobus sp.]